MTIDQVRLAAIQERGREIDPDQEAMEHIATAIRRRLAQQDERIARLETALWNQGLLLQEQAQLLRKLAH